MAPVSDRLPYELLGGSQLVRDCVAEVDRAAADERHALITAERGFDVVAVARTVHARSARRRGPFVVAGPEGVAGEVERRLFGGSPRPAASPNRSDKKIGPELIGQASALAKAAGGVLFIPSVEDLPGGVQRRLARLLRDGEIRLSPNGAPAPLDVRLIAATENRLDDGLRDDLARRLPVVIEVPALARRREDVPAIAQAMLTASDGGRTFTPAAQTVLRALPWRRNISELAGLIARLTATSGMAPIRQEDVLAEVQLERAPVRARGTLRDARRQFEREYIASVLRDHEWRMRDAARALGIERANLYRKARQLGISLRRDGDTGSRRSVR